MGSEIKYIDSGAQISPCEKYRFTLWRVWDESLPRVAFVGLNPSTADATQDDPTIRRCRGFAMSHGFGAFTMLNLWAYRATDPKNLPAVVTNEEEINADCIARVASGVARVVAVWGAHPKGILRKYAILPLVDEWWHLGMTKDGEPRHPLYLPGDAKMVRWSSRSPFNAVNGS